MDDRPDSQDRRSLGDLVEQFEDSLPSLLGHLYRGEIDRTTSWRDRLDRTTNWAVTIEAALLTWVFSSSDNPHYLLLVGMLAIVAFHFIDTRRYLTYDVWRARVRLLEEDVFAAALDPEDRFEHEEWRGELSEDLRHPARKTPFGEAYSRRLRRVYLPLLGVLLVAWVVRITVFAPDEGTLASAAIVDIPGTVVVGVVAVFYLAAVAVSFWPHDRQAMGEVYERGKEGEWK